MVRRAPPCRSVHNQARWAARAIRHALIKQLQTKAEGAGQSAAGKQKRNRRDARLRRAENSRASGRPRRAAHPPGEPVGGRQGARLQRGGLLGQAGRGCGERAFQRAQLERQAAVHRIAVVPARAQRSPRTRRRDRQQGELDTGRRSEAPVQPPNKFAALRACARPGSPDAYIPRLCFPRLCWLHSCYTRRALAACTSSDR